MLIIITLLETCSWTEFEGHLNHIHNYEYPIHMTNLNPDMATADM